MIKIARSGEPAILRKKKPEWTQKLRVAVTRKEREKALHKYRHREVRRTLEEMFHGKCAYCESKILHVSYGHIEHFRPKSDPRFVDLVFEWSNLLLACGRCNGAENKGDRFPDAREGGPPVNPCDDDPEESFQFEYDASTRVASVYGKTPRGLLTVELLGLNRYHLRMRRSSFVKKLAYVASKSEDDSEARALLADATRDDAEYAAFARSLMAKVGR
jgi:uncharacterized protein (TIGR02646 family)